MSNATKSNQIGALWRQKSKSTGKVFYTGAVLNQRVVMFENKSENDKAPVFTFILDTNEGESNG